MNAAAQKRSKMISYAKYGYMFILPFFIAYAFFMIYPLINTFFLSFRGNGDTANEFVGLQNFQWLLFGQEGKYSPGAAIQEEFMRSIGNTLILWAGNFVLQRTAFRT